MKKKKVNWLFNRFTTTVAKAMGHPWVFIIALVILIIWGISGPILGFSDTWQLIINTSTTIVTFLMVFIIQNTQNRDNMAINLKLDVMMEKMGLDTKEIISAELKSDEHLERRVKKEQKKAGQPKPKRGSRPTHIHSPLVR